MKMGEWRKKLYGDDHWHWRKECPHYPREGEGEFIKMHNKPNIGPFCTICSKLDTEEQCG